MTRLELACFLDLKTSKLLEVWENPITGQTVEVPGYRTKPFVSMITAADVAADRPPLIDEIGNYKQHVFRPPVVGGDNIWFTQERYTAVDPPARKTAHRYNEMSTYLASVAELNNPDLVTVPATIQYQSLLRFFPWYQMGDIEGLDMGRGSGATADRVEDLPTYVSEPIEKLHPDALNNPLALLNQA